MRGVVLDPTFRGTHVACLQVGISRYRGDFTALVRLDHPARDDVLSLNRGNLARLYPVRMIQFECRCGRRNTSDSYHNKMKRTMPRCRHELCLQRGDSRVWINLVLSPVPVELACCSGYDPFRLRWQVLATYDPEANRGGLGSRGLGRLQLGTGRGV